MTTIIKSIEDLKNQINVACERAIESASQILLKELQEYINEDYYDLYEPIYYKRTYAFYKSAVAHITGKSSSMVGIDNLYMSYQYPANYNYLDGETGHWTGEDQVYMADAGFHGNASIYRDGHFWKDFEQFCKENAINILKLELKKQGLNIQ